MSTVLITGGTGMVGKALTIALKERGYDVIILTRNLPASASSKQIRYAHWDIYKQTIDEWAIKEADYIIHLAGASLAEKKWSKKRKEEIVSSRVESGKLIVKSLKNIPNKVKAVLSASASGWYGSDSDIRNKAFTETDPAANDFLGQTCKKWEAAIAPVANLNIRLVTLRIGIVLSKEGGALTEFKKPLKFGIASILGSGEQYLSWIHIDDLVRVFLFMIDNESISGIFNAVSPNPVTNKQLILELASADRGKRYIPVHVPSFLLKIILGEMSVEILKSFTVSADKISQAGFIFQYPAIKSALNQF